MQNDNNSQVVTVRIFGDCIALMYVVLQSRFYSCKEKELVNFETTRFTGNCNVLHLLNWMLDAVWDVLLI